ncbi:MAG: hypothetical protein QNJ47_22605 [Nostocaceae cyanobacterium]|nr:hypothetical protein [Nostocaceae cyanobacterium]
MAPPKNNLLNLLSISPSFFSQLVVGIFLAVLFANTGVPPSLSLFLGITAGFILGGLTSANQNRPQSQNLDSSKGIDAGVKYWLFFLLGFILIGHTTSTSILLSGIAGIAAGWIIAWWNSKEETKTQLPEATGEQPEVEEKIPRHRITTQRSRRSTRRYRRESGISNLKFWERDK